MEINEEVCVTSGGTQMWYKNRKLHRDNDLPAIIWTGGNQEWYKNGVCHRENDLPAIVTTDGTHAWYKNGNLHRDNGPTVINVNGSEVEKNSEIPSALVIDNKQAYTRFSLR